MGASGKLGSELVLRLAHMGFQSRAATHNPQKVNQIFNYPAIETVSFDYNDQKSVAQAMENIDTLFILTPVVTPLAEYVKKSVQVAMRSTISHIVFFSVMGAGRTSAGNIATWYKQAEEEIVKSDIPYTILRPNCLMQNLLRYIQPESGIIYLPMAEGEVSFIDARDVAAVAADIVLPGAHHLGKVYELTGPDAHSMHSIAEILSRIIGSHIGYVNIAEDTAGYTLEGKIPDWRIDVVLQYFRFLSKGGGASVTGTVESVAGIEPVSFVDFARDYAEDIRALVAHRV
jgi:uncharacterized protein YbjT (DUF2867 family)